MISFLKFVFKYLGLVVSLSIKNKYIFRIYNYIYENSPYRIVKLMVQYVQIPAKDNYWTIWLLNGNKIRTMIYADNIKTAQFALSYKWHSPPLNFTEKLLNEYYANDIPWIDIGANMGIRSLLSLSKKRPVFFIEPNMELNKINIERCKLNSFENYTLFELGASDKTGTVEFTVDKTSYNSSIEVGLLPEDSIDHKEIIRIDTIDHIFEDSYKSLRAACIKIDVEGHELHVLEGAKTFIELLSPTMIIEVNDKGEHFTEFLRMIREYRYEIFEIGNFGKRVYYKKILEGPNLNIDCIRNNDFFAIKDKMLLKTIRKYTLN